jgi:hypothetical protein
MAGLDPAIQKPETQSPPLDYRVKPGNDIQTPVSGLSGDFGHDRPSRSYRRQIIARRRPDLQGSRR